VTTTRQFGDASMLSSNCTNGRRLLAATDGNDGVHLDVPA
jgi:hypothetical protein